MNKWSNLSPDLQNYFVKHTLILILLIVAEIPIDLTTKEKDITLFFFVITIAYASWIIFFMIKAFNELILLFEGICESVSIVRKDIRKPLSKSAALSLYGKSTMTMSIVNDDGINIDEAKFIVPIPGNSKMQAGNTVRVYSIESSIISINDNTFEITNPLIVKVSKT